MILPRWFENALMDNVPNSAFAVTCDTARTALREMRADPRALQRPVVALSGWRAASLLPKNLISNLAPLTLQGPSMFVPVAYPLETNFEKNAAKVVEAVESKWPSPDPRLTTEVDVVAVSMGGLVARVAAAPQGAMWPPTSPMMGNSDQPPRKQLRIRRLFTIGSPHRGAWLADRIAIDAAAKAMKSGTTFIERLDRALQVRPIEMHCYARLHDEMVGATRCSPLGTNPYWLSGLRFGSHVTIGQDPRILADIARRLRGETPYATVSGPPPRD